MRRDLQQQGKQSVKYRIVAITGYDPNRNCCAADLRSQTNSHSLFFVSQLFKASLVKAKQE
jgi:hypothetical protein